MSSFMDIPVSRLNQRMALQLPSEFPLGMVFVVGVVEGKEPGNEGDAFGYFYLVEKSYRVRCLLSSHTTTETEFNDGDRIRAGGHLAFDPRIATYYLLARETEILTGSESEGPSPEAIMADIDRTSQQAGLVPAELPVWVKQLAPPELMAELGITLPDESDAAETDIGIEEDTPDDYDIGQRADGKMLPMSEELIDFLSMAMDSSDEIELTPEVIAHLGTPNDPEEVLKESAETEETDWLDDLEAVTDARQEVDALAIEEPEIKPVLVLETEHDLEAEPDIEAEQTLESELEPEVDSEIEPAIDEIVSTDFEIEKNGRGFIDIDQDETVDDVMPDEEVEVATETVIAMDIESEIERQDQLESESERKRSTPWPEIIVVLLILAALILSFAVVWIVAAR
jgi:hypothetical protein